ncbi:MAG TPA: class I SAM-dependent methyltransferase [Polyangiaceae bacterium]|jgi:SAM-dependent methyltransferase|nr:class I SAM-dependent methyltransferase [Polyangiaceae bacterium]
MTPAAAAEDPARMSRCGLCGGTGRPLFVKRGIGVLRCDSCRNAFVPRSQIPDDLESIYSSAYFEGGEATGYPGYLADREILARNFVERLEFIEGARPPGRRLLDVGAAYGLFLKAARERGWDGSGVEIAPDCALEAARISGASVACGDFLDVPLTGPYDVIVMLDVIEHLRDPAAAVARALKLLSPGGLFVVETGDLRAPWARLLGRRWYFFDPPAHLFYFSYRGLTALLRRAGFLPDFRVRRAGRRVSATNIVFKLAAAARGPLRNILTAASQRGVPGSLYLNFGDGMLIAARKP